MADSPTPSPSPSNESELAASWDANAESWTSVVRRGAIPSRRAGTDAAILDACARVLHGRAAPRVLDVGCGEGWLARELAAGGADVLGVDGAAALIERAREAGGTARFEVADYARIVDDARTAAGPWELIICNFALLGEDIAPLLEALAHRLAPTGSLLIQTVHPWSHASVEPPYADGWRRETWSAFGGEFAAPMPWYFRTLETWVARLRGAGLALAGVREPRHPETGQPLSLLMEGRRIA